MQPPPPLCAPLAVNTTETRRPDVETLSSLYFSRMNKTINTLYLQRSSADNNNKFRPHPVRC
jgi:hypothetical protein